MESKLLCKDVILIKNAVSDVDRMYKILLQSKKVKLPRISHWMDWKPWGEYAKIYPFEERGWEEDQVHDTSWLIRESLNSFFFALKECKEKYLNQEYFDMWNQPSDFPTSWEDLINQNVFGIGDILVAESINTNPSKNLSMEYHKDRRMWPNPTFPLFNYNIYVNGDYEGGEISFIDIDNVEESTYVDKDGITKKCYMIEDPVIYNMEAGDGLLFRTDVAHAVWPIKGNKIYLRQFLMGKPDPEYTRLQQTLSNEDFELKMKEIEKDGFANLWHGNVFATKEDIDTNSLPENHTIYVLKSGNKNLVPEKNRYSFENGEAMALYETDPLYVFNERKDPIKIEENSSGICQTK